jgi:predicted RNase H-like HicB family nuclease
MKLDAIITKEAGGTGADYVALCIQYGVVSQGDSIDHAVEMLKEAVALYLDDAETWRKPPAEFVGVISFEHDPEG